MNQIVLIGNLTNDPATAVTQSEVSYTRFNIAVNRRIADANGNRAADYFDVICWRALADNCAKFLHKGSKVGIRGSVQRRQYEDRDSIKRTSFDVVADEVEFLSSTKPNSQETAYNQRSGAKCVDREDSRADSDSRQEGANKPFTGDLQPVPQEEADELSF